MSDEMTDETPKSFALETVQSNDDHKYTIEDLIREVMNLRMALKEMKDEIIEDMNEVTGLLIEHCQQVIAKHLNGSNILKTDFDIQSSTESGTESGSEPEELASNQTEKSGQNREDSNDLMIEKEIE